MTNGADSLICNRHFAVIHTAAEIYGLDGKELYNRVVKRFRSPRDVFRVAAENTNLDYDRARIVALAACYEAERFVESRNSTRKGGENGRPNLTNITKIIHHSPVPTTFTVEKIKEPLLRDTLYLYYWLGFSFQKISEMQMLKTLTVRQNHKKALKLLHKESLNSHT